jgi:hypothetical protein
MLVSIEVIALILLALVFLFNGDWRLGVAQMSYALATIVLFWT